MCYSVFGCFTDLCLFRLFVFVSLLFGCCRFDLGIVAFNCLLVLGFVFLCCFVVWLNFV